LADAVTTVPLPEEDVVFVSAIEHFAYCPRQFALIHVEQTFEDNALTLSGDRMHERADVARVLRHEGVRAEYAVPLWSDTLGLSGRADVVEFMDDGTVWPVEYKHGDRRPKRHDDLQLCAQALCLEEMLGVEVPSGSVFYHKSRRWREVRIDDLLRGETLAAVEAVRATIRSAVMPPPLNDARCRQCSLIDICQPELVCEARGHDVDAELFTRENGVVL
jgi:CRISPR-associated exonuclease Cas4